MPTARRPLSAGQRHRARFQPRRHLPARSAARPPSALSPERAECLRTTACQSLQAHPFRPRDTACPTHRPSRAEHWDTPWVGPARVGPALRRNLSVQGLRKPEGLMGNHCVDPLLPRSPSFLGITDALPHRPLVVSCSVCGASHCLINRRDLILPGQMAC